MEKPVKLQKAQVISGIKWLRYPASFLFFLQMCIFVPILATGDPGAVYSTIFAGPALAINWVSANSKTLGLTALWVLVCIGVLVSLCVWLTTWWPDKEEGGNQDKEIL